MGIVCYRMVYETHPEFWPIDWPELRLPVASTGDPLNCLSATEVLSGSKNWKVWEKHLISPGKIVQYLKNDGKSWNMNTWYHLCISTTAFQMQDSGHTSRWLWFTRSPGSIAGTWRLIEFGHGKRYFQLWNCRVDIILKSCPSTKIRSG